MSEQEFVRIRIARIQGSSPREAGAEMFVSPDGLAGTIGGGQLEYMAMDRARQMLAQGVEKAHMDVPLGPEIGQCCGGRVGLTLERLDEASRMAAAETASTTARALPDVLVFGAGHVGRALVRALAPLPVGARLIDGRADELAKADCAETCLTALPEREIVAARSGAAFVIATHDHALDFLLAAEALRRSDAAYVGMIGSATKRARFESWARDHAYGANVTRLTCPIGRAGLGDKRPEVIAAHVAVEVLAAVSSQTLQVGMEREA